MNASTETQITTATVTVATSRPELLGAMNLMVRLSEHLGVSVPELLPRIALPRKGGKDKRRLFTGAQARTIYLRDEGICFHCGAEVAPDACHIDHIIPHSLGGRTVEENGVVSCPHCNVSRGNKLYFVV